MCADAVPQVLYIFLESSNPPAHIINKASPVPTEPGIIAQKPLALTQSAVEVSGDIR